MFSGWLRWFPGWVRAEGEGGYPERLLNELIRDGIPVWRVTCRREWIRFSCLAGDYRRLRPNARRACVRLRLRQKHGLPFWAFRYRHRKGLAVGLCLYGVLLGLLSSRIWVVQVTGNTTTPAATILETAKEYGVTVGAPMADMDIKGLQINGPDKLDTLSFITVNPNGCVARVEVTERSPTPEILDLSRPSDIVAVRDGRVLWMEVRSGQRVVMNGEAVSGGTTLISGRVESELGQQLYRSYGKVWAETRRQITVTVPLLYTRHVFTGERVFRPTITFLCWEIPLYSGGPLQAETVRETAHFLQAKGMTLPLGLTHRYHLYTREEKTARTEEEAAILAKQQLARQEKSLFAACVYEELEREATVRGDSYVLTVSYRCEEDIALEILIETVE